MLTGKDCASNRAVKEVNAVLQAAFLSKHNLPFEAVPAAELESVKIDLAQVLNSMNKKEAAAELTRGETADTFYKVPHHCLSREKRCRS